MHGFIVTDPQLNFSDNGVARFYACVGVEHFRKEPDGSFTPLEPTFHDLVLFRRSAERAYDRFRKGDSFVASGYVHEYDTSVAGRPSRGRSSSASDPSPPQGPGQGQKLTLKCE